MPVTLLMTRSYFWSINKEYLSATQIFFIDRSKAVSAAHFDANPAVLRQTVQN